MYTDNRFIGTVIVFKENIFYVIFVEIFICFYLGARYLFVTHSLNLTTYTINKHCSSLQILAKLSMTALVVCWPLRILILSVTCLSFLCVGIASHSSFFNHVTSRNCSFLKIVEELSMNALVRPLCLPSVCYVSVPCVIVARLLSFFNQNTLPQLKTVKWVPVNAVQWLWPLRPSVCLVSVPCVIVVSLFSIFYMLLAAFHAAWLKRIDGKQNITNWL